VINVMDWGVAGNDWYQSALVKADVLLKDFIKVIHPDNTNVQTHELTYLRDMHNAATIVEVTSATCNNPYPICDTSVSYPFMPICQRHKYKVRPLCTYITSFPYHHVFACTIVLTIPLSPQPPSLSTFPPQQKCVDGEHVFLNPRKGCSKLATCSLADGEKAAIGVLVPVGFILIVLVLFCCYKRKRDNEMKALQAQQQQSNPESGIKALA